MMPATLVAPTIPTPPRIVLIRVVTHYTDEGPEEPYWHVIGTLVDYEFTHRMLHGKHVTLGDQSDGSYIVDVTRLGLNPDNCLAYAYAEERWQQLIAEEDMFNIRGYLRKMIDEQSEIMGVYEPAITAAVNRFDAVMRLRHIPDHPAIETAAPAPAPAPAPVATSETVNSWGVPVPSSTHPSTDRPPWADASTTIPGYY